MVAFTEAFDGRLMAANRTHELLMTRRIGMERYALCIRDV